MNIHKSPYSAEEEEGGGRRRKEEEEGERRAPNKAGPMRPPLLNGIKWGCKGTIGTNYGLDQGSYSEEEGGRRKEEGGRRKEKDWPLIRLAL